MQSLNPFANPTHLRKRLSAGSRARGNGLMNKRERSERALSEAAGDYRIVCCPNILESVV
jgi:hypothetical protein